MRKKKVETFVSVLDKPEYKEQILRSARQLRDALVAAKNGESLKTLFPFASGK